MEEIEVAGIWAFSSGLRESRAALYPPWLAVQTAIEFLLQSSAKVGTCGRRQPSHQTKAFSRRDLTLSRSSCRTCQKVSLRFTTNGPTLSEGNFALHNKGSGQGLPCFRRASSAVWGTYGIAPNAFECTSSIHRWANARSVLPSATEVAVCPDQVRCPSLPA